MTKNLLVIPIAAATFLSVAGARLAGSSRGEPALSNDGPFPTVWSGVYSKTEAERGRQAYKEFCSRCHGTDLKGGLTAPGLAGAKFFDRWHDRRLADVVAYIQAAMPREHEFYVPADSARAIASLMLQESGVPAGKEVMSADVNIQRTILITRPRLAR